MIVYDPFDEGDMIFWERGGIPVQVYVKNENNLYRALSMYYYDTYTLEYLLQYFRNNASGPYKVDQVSNWSVCDFTNEKILQERNGSGVDPSVD